MPILLLVFFLSASAVLADDRLGLPAIAVPQDKALIQLGKDLFNDTHFSANNTISCASCHAPEKAFTDQRAKSQGIYGQIGSRNAPTLLNVAFFKQFFHDGRASSLEQQALGPLLNPVEHGLESPEHIERIIHQNPDYVQRFSKIFNIDKHDIRAEHLAKAIAAYERTLIAGNSDFDQYYFGRNRSRLSKSAARGLLIFRRKGNCANCHEISMSDALFTDNRFYNLGQGFEKIEAILPDFLAAIKQGQNPDDFPMTPEQRAELGRFNVTHVLQDIGKFKTPTLRNIALTAPYMHDGSIKTLEDVVDYYDKGGRKNPYLDSAIYPLHLTEQEKADLVAFMRALTSEKRP